MRQRGESAEGAGLPSVGRLVPAAQQARGGAGAARTSERDPEVRGPAGKEGKEARGKRKKSSAAPRGVVVWRPWRRENGSVCGSCVAAAEKEEEKQRWTSPRGDSNYRPLSITTPRAVAWQTTTQQEEARPHHHASRVCRRLRVGAWTTYILCRASSPGFRGINRPHGIGLASAEDGDL